MTKNIKDEEKEKEKEKEEDQEDIDELFEEHLKNENYSLSDSNSQINFNCPFNEALSIDPAWLDANVELKKKFGGAVSGGNSVLGEINSHAQGRNHNLAALNKAIKRKPFKRKNGFITPRPLWPPFGPAETGLSVTLTHKAAEFDEYEIIESHEYQSTFEELEILARTGDFEFLIELMRIRPLFIDGLLLLSDAYRMQSTGDASEIVERALYILERILPNDLSFLNGRTRFRYSHPANRKLHLCLFRQLQFTMKKGCWRVSLQLAKALLSLDPENDPLAARLFIDFLALQSDSLEDFDKLWIQLERACPLGPLPGWIFNRALKSFLEEEKNAKTNDHLESSKLLIEAVCKCPGSAALLFQALKIKIPQSFPLQESFEADLALVGSSKIFLARCISLWKSPNVLAWIESSLKSSSFSQLQSINFRSVSIIHQISIYRHSLLSDLPALNVAIPTQISSISSLNAYDPLPSESFDENENGTGSGSSLIAGLRDLFIGSFSRTF